MAVVKTYYPAENFVVRIHDDAFAKTPEEIQRCLDEMARISRRIIDRKLRDGIPVEKIFEADMREERINDGYCEDAESGRVNASTVD